MITLHHCVSARSFRPLWTLEELGLAYDLVLWPFPPRLHRPEYLDIQPAGTVPALQDGAVTLTESAAMCQYLVSRYGPTPLAVAVDEPSYGAYLNALHQGEATLTFPQTLVLRYGRFEPESRRLPQVVEDYGRWFMARLRMIDSVVVRQDWLCDRFTAADISVGYALMLADYIGLSERFSPAVMAYWRRLQERPAYRRALEKEQVEAQAQGVPLTPAPLTGQ